MSIAAAILGILPAALEEAIKLIGDLVEAGKDPVEEIRRIRATDPVLAEVERSWELELARRFDRESYEDGAPATLPDDPYADLDAEDEW